MPPLDSKCMKGLPCLVAGQNIIRQNISDKIYCDKTYRTKYIKTKYMYIPVYIYFHKMHIWSKYSKTKCLRANYVETKSIQTKYIRTKHIETKYNGQT